MSFSVPTLLRSYTVPSLRLESITILRDVSKRLNIYGRSPSPNACCSPISLHPEGMQAIGRGMSEATTPVTTKEVGFVALRQNEHAFSVR